MGHGIWRKNNPASKAVDGSVDPHMNHHHCAFVQNTGSLTHAWAVDLRDIYDVEKLFFTHHQVSAYN